MVSYTPLPLSRGDLFLSILISVIILAVEIFVYLRVDRILSGAADIHHDEHYQINESQFSLHDAAVMHMEESKRQRYQHRDHAQPEESTDDEEDGAWNASGLELSLTKKLVDLLGGRIVVKTASGAGTKFVVYLEQI